MAGKAQDQQHEDVSHVSRLRRETPIPHKSLVTRSSAGANLVCSSLFEEADARQPEERFLLRVATRSGEETKPP